MIKAMRLTSIVLFLILIFSLTACSNSNDQQPTSAKQENSEDLAGSESTAIKSTQKSHGDTDTEVKPIETALRVPDPQGINLGNIANGSFWTFQGNELFYTAGYDLGIYNLETGEIERIMYHGGHNNAISGNNWYYSGLHVFRIVDLATEDYQEIPNLQTRQMNLKDDWIYFVNYRQDDTVYRMKADTTQQEQLNTFTSVRILLHHDGYLYFTAQSENSRLYRMKEDGSELMKLVDDWVNFFIIYEDMLYFSQHGEEGLFKSHLDGSGKTRLLNEYADYFNITNGYIFHSSRNNNFHLYRVAIDGSDNQLWLDQYVVHIHVHGDYVYFFDNSDSQPKVVKMHYNAKVFEEVPIPLIFN